MDQRIWACGRRNSPEQPLLRGGGAMGARRTSAFQCSRAQNGADLGQGGSPRHGETNWAHGEGDLGFAGAHHGEGRRGFAGDRCKGAYGALPDLKLSAKGQGGGAVSYRGSRRPGSQRRDVGGAAARWWRLGVAPVSNPRAERGVEGVGGGCRRTPSPCGAPVWRRGRSWPSRWRVRGGVSALLGGARRGGRARVLWRRWG